MTGLVLLPALNAQPTRPDSRFAAKVLTEYGQVSVLRDGYPFVLNAGDAILVQQTVVTGPDSYARFQLADNTTIDIFANSKMLFRGSSPSWLDTLYVMIGRIKIFEEHTKGENAKKVTTPTAVISVRGTIYDVAVQDDDGTTFVSVDEGAVEVTNQTAPGRGVTLFPGQSITVFRGQPLAALHAPNGDAFRVLLKAAQNAIYQAVYGRPTGPIGAPGGPVATTGGSNGDTKSKTGGGTGSGTTNGAPIPGH